MIKVISFDIGGTLLRSVYKKGYSISDLSLLLKLPKEQIRKEYKVVFQNMNSDLESLLNEFCNRLNIEVTPKLRQFIIEKYSNKQLIDIISIEDINLIKYLKNKGYKIILVSNNCCLQKSSLDNDFLNQIEYVFNSYEIGYNKSESKLYNIIETKMGYKSCEFLHIGDTLESDYICPIKNGWNALFLTNKIIENIVTINKLEEVIDYLEKVN